MILIIYLSPKLIKISNSIHCYTKLISKELNFTSPKNWTGGYRLNVVTRYYFHLLIIYNQIFKRWVQSQFYTDKMEKELDKWY